MFIYRIWDKLLSASLTMNLTAGRGLQSDAFSLVQNSSETRLSPFPVQAGKIIAI
jgi:hypothetical protein